MKQLNIQDVGFLYQDTDATPMHICGVGIYDQTDVKSRRPKIAGIIKYIEDRLHLAPILKQRLVHSPRQIERPYWDEDANFKLENHVEQLTLDKPGTMEQLYAKASELIEGPLPEDQPLWKVYVIEGLNAVENVGQGSFAILTKIHHACIDGASGNNVMSVLHDLEPNAKPIAPPANDEEKALPVQYGRYEGIARAYASNVVEAIEQSRNVTKRAPALLSTAFDLYRGKKDAGAKFKVPQTRFNKSPGTDRVYNASVFPLSKIKEIKNAVPNATVNDVMVSIIAGALNKYLSFHGELPELPLGATMPQNTRDEAMAKEKHGNHIGGLFATIHTDVYDPVQRLKAIHNSIAKAKRFADEADTAAIFPALMGGFLYPKVGKAVTKFSHKHRLMERFGPLLTNTIITNVPGPNFALYHDGAKMVHYAGVLPLVDGIGLGHAIYSYFGKITISTVSCSEMLPDSDFYMQCCNESYLELCAALDINPEEAQVAQTEAAEEVAKAQPAATTKSKPKRRVRKAKKAEDANDVEASIDAELIESLTSSSVDHEELPRVANG